MEDENLPLLLIVDDEERNLYSTKKTLEDLDITIHTALSGEEALKAVINNEYFLILMDVLMPGMDGFETLAIIRGNENYKHIPIIFITAISKEEEYIDAGYDEGAVDYLFKPVNPHTLFCKIKVFLELYLNKKELISAKLSAEQANEEKSRFMANITHELRTPLNAIIGTFELFARGIMSNKSQAEIEEFVSMGIQSAEHLLELINDLLDIKKAEQGKIEYKIVNQLLKPIVQEAISMAQEFANRYGIKINFDTIGNDEITIAVDALRLVQVLVNLLSNAIKFTTKEDHILVTIEQSEDQVKLSITDHGNGIPLEHQPKIFTEFFQANPNGDFAIKGSGLGLSLCKKMIEDMHATIDFVSVPNESTTFFILFNQVQCEPSLYTESQIKNAINTT